MSGYVVAAYAQHLGIFLLELLVSLAERGGLGGSSRGEIKYVKREDHVLLPLVLAQGDVALADRGECKIRGYRANICGHLSHLLSDIFPVAPAVGHLKDYTPSTIGLSAVKLAKS